ncbi:MAG TPA: hypothetical protein VFG35_04470, partial [Actinoplanes sp.]|nr:hypothetical protein [Actinoplanes sp.]
ERFTRSELTMLDEKAKSYAAEAGYRESLYELAHRVGDHRHLGEVLRRTGVGLLRPDAIAYRRADDALDYFARLGIRPGGVVPVDVTRQGVRELWRYQLNTASGERLRLLDLVFEASPALLVLFDADPGTPAVPCTVLMADCKGPAAAEDRQGWELRTFLGSPNRVEVYVHCCDEPADVVRDGGLLAGPDVFARAFADDRDPRAGEAVRSMARELAGSVRRDVPEGFAPRFQRFLGRSGEHHTDRWALLREVAQNCAMVAGPGETLISRSGISLWWEHAATLPERHKYFASRTGWTGGDLTEPLD